MSGPNCILEVRVYDLVVGCKGTWEVGVRVRCNDASKGWTAVEDG